MPYLPTTHTALEEALLAASGTTFIGLDTSTEPKLTGGQSNPHRDRVRKVMLGANVMIFQNVRSSAYDSMVKRRLRKEGKDPSTFRLSPRAWGNRIQGTPFVEHNGDPAQFMEACKEHAPDVQPKLMSQGELLLYKK